MLTPKYSVGCKRRVFGGGWFEGLRGSKVNQEASWLVLELIKIRARRLVWVLSDGRKTLAAVVARKGGTTGAFLLAGQEVGFVRTRISQHAP